MPPATTAELKSLLQKFTSFSVFAKEFPSEAGKSAAEAGKSAEDTQADQLLMNVEADTAEDP